MMNQVEVTSYTFGKNKDMTKIAKRKQFKIIINSNEN